MERLKDLWRRELSYKPLLILLGVGLLLRIALFAFYSPGIIFSLDAARFTQTAPTVDGTFDDIWMPAGYSMYLSVVHFISSQLWLPIAIQHLVALGVAVAVYLTLRRVNLSQAAATVGAAVLVLPGDLLFLEHAVLIDSWMLSLAALACCAAIRGLVPKVNLKWLAAAGVLAGLTMVFRSVGLAVIPALILIAIAATASPWRPRLLSGAVVAAGSVTVLLVYVGAFHASDGRYLGISDMSGWNLYSRVAPFAVCSEFEVPKGTEQLCDPTPVDKRPGPDYYGWFSPDVSTEASEVRGRFARATIKGQPKTYAEAVLTDLGRYVEPSIKNTPLGGTERAFVAFDNPGLDPVLGKNLRARDYVKTRYSGVSEPRGGADAFGVYQRVVRIHGLLLPFLLIAVIAGLIKLPGPQRIAIGTFGLASAGLYILPTLTFSYDYRYGVPPGALLAIAAVVAVAGLYVQLRARGAPAAQPRD